MLDNYSREHEGWLNILQLLKRSATLVGKITNEKNTIWSIQTCIVG